MPASVNSSVSSWMSGFSGNISSNTTLPRVPLEPPGFICLARNAVPRDNTRPPRDLLLRLLIDTQIPLVIDKVLDAAPLAERATVH